MQKIIDRIKLLNDNGWNTTNGYEITKLNKSYSISTLMKLEQCDFDRFLRTNCLYAILGTEEEEYNMIFNTPGLPQPTPENVQMHTSDVYAHIDNVAKFMSILSNDMNKRGAIHDASKFSEEEMSYYATYTPNLKGLTYGSEEYKDNLKQMQPAIDHHYAKNAHHPEHYPDGIAGMDLVDVVEMICDWKAASMRHANGNILKSMEINQKRFNIDPQLYSILMNTIERYFKD